MVEDFVRSITNYWYFYTPFFALAATAIVLLLRHYTRKLARVFPVMEWLTFSEVVAVGCPRTVTRILLFSLWEEGIIEARVATDLPKGVDPEWLAEWGPLIYSAHCYDWRLKEEPPKRRRREERAEEEDRLGAPVYT